MCVVCVMWAFAIQSVWNKSASVYPHVKVCVCEKQTCIAGTRVIVVSHAVRTQGMLEALQSEFVAAK